jgi:hypothetical protein
VRDCASGREVRSGGQGGAADQPGRGRFDRGAGRAGSGGFGDGTGRRTSVAGLQIEFTVRAAEGAKEIGAG